MYRNRRALVSVCCLFSALLASPGGAQTIDDAFRMDIEKLMEVTGASARGAQMATLTADAMIDGMKKSQSVVPERVMEIVREVLNEEFGRAFEGPDGMTIRMIPIYAKHFTHEEVRGLLAFYATDLGTKAIKTLPALMEEGAAVGRRWAEETMPRIQQVLLARLKAEGFVP